MVVLTGEDRLIWCELHRRACAGSPDCAHLACIHYRDLGVLIDPEQAWHSPMSRPPFRGFNDALGHVSQYEFEHGRPLLSCLATAVDTSDESILHFDEKLDSLHAKLAVLTAAMPPDDLV
jgi:hypothetical protein